MKHLNLLALFLSVAILSCAQSYPVGTRTVTYIDPARSNRSVDVDVHYPAVSAGSNAVLAADSFPFIVFGHGFQMTASAYYPFADSLAARGYIVAFPATESSLSPSHASFAQDLIFVYNTLITENSNVASPFCNHVISKGAIAGHSMGGGCTILSAQYGNPAICYFTMAEATTNPSSITAASFMTKPYLSFAGSYDCIAPYGTNQQPTYDSSHSPCKVLIEITGASHCQFGAGNFQCNLGEGVSNCANPPLSRTAQINTVLEYLEPYLDYYLKGIAPASASFDSIYAADNTNTKTRSCSSSPNGINNLTSEHISIYPNPATNFIYIKSNQQIRDINLIDELGQRIMSEKSSTDKLNISSVSRGVYIVQVTTIEDRSSFFRVIKE